MVHDPAMLSATAYLSAGHIQAAATHVRKAKDMLFGKIKNPYAAALGAYTLLKYSDADNERWPKWIENLNQRFDWFPDGAVLLGWLNIERKNIAAACENFTAAYHLGIPLYSHTLKLMVDGVRILSSESADINAIRPTIETIALQINPVQTFTTLQVGPDAH